MDGEKFELMLAPFQKMKKEHIVNKRLNFYKGWVDKKRRAAERVRLITLFLSLSIPVVAYFDLNQQALIVSIMSLSIAFLYGLNDLYKWQHLWEAYSKAIILIEAELNSWELKVIKAKHLDQPDQILQILEKATKTLLDSVDEIVSNESGFFFASLKDKREPIK